MTIIEAMRAAAARENAAMRRSYMGGSYGAGSELASKLTKPTIDLVTAALRKAPDQSPADLSETTGLSLSSVRRVLTLLGRRGEVRKRRPGPHVWVYTMTECDE